MDSGKDLSLLGVVEKDEWSENEDGQFGEVLSSLLLAVFDGFFWYFT